MTSTVVQTPATVDTVVDALGTLAPGWRDRTGISHDRGWTTVPMDPTAARRFAPLLARLLGIGVLLWEAEAEAGTCRVTLFQQDGEVVGPVDTADADAVDPFIKTVTTHFPMNTTAAFGKDRARLLAEASSDSAGAGRHRAFAGVLGISYAEPVAPAASNPSNPVLSEASVLTVAGPIQGRRRLERARTVVQYLTYAAILGFFASFWEPGWPVNAFVLVVVAVLGGIWALLGLRLKKLRQDQ